MQNPFSWSYLTAPISNTPTWGPFSITFVALFGVGLILSLILYNDLFRQLRKNKLLYDAVRKGSGILIPIFAIGLFFFMFRFMRVSAFYLSLRLWLYLSFLAFVACMTYFVYYMRTIYPVHVKAEEAKRLKQRYLTPSPSASSISRGQRHSRRRKRARSGYKSAQR